MLSSGGSQGPSLRCLGAGDRKGAADTASPPSGRSAAEDLGGSRIWSAAAARRPACPAGEILVPQRLAAVTAGSSDHRDMQGRACRTREEACTGHPLEALHLSTAGAEPRLTLKAAHGVELRRHSTATTLVPGRCRSGRRCRSRSYAPMAQISETAGISSIAPSEHQAERPLSARLGGLGQGNGKGRDAPEAVIFTTALAAFTALLNWKFAAPKSTAPAARLRSGDGCFPCCSSEGVAMIVEINRSSPPETYRVAIGSLTRERQSSWVPSRAPETANLVDGGGLAVVVSPPPSRWPRIFPSL